MSFAKISDAECTAIHLLRVYAPNDSRRNAKREIFARAKVAFGIPADHKMTVEVDVAKPDAGVLKNKVSRATYELGEDGKWVHAAAAAAQAKRWFKLPIENLFDTIHEGIDSIDNIGGAIMSQVDQPASSVMFGVNTNNAVVVASNGDVWIQLDADAFDSEDASTSTEEDDDLPY